jgi:hypothetical protein
MNDPENKPAPEIRGGDRPADYIPEDGSGGFGLIGWQPHRDPEKVPDSPGCACGPECPDFAEDDEPPGANDPEAQ